MNISSIDSGVTPLRSSCDRCRAQKLRCIPSSETDPKAPCQRCLRAKEPKLCVFSRRLRTGRQVKMAEHSDTQPRKPTRREKEAAMTHPLPGMSSFALSTSTAPPRDHAAEQQSMVRESMSPNEAGSALLGLIDNPPIGLWEENHDNRICDPSHQQPSDFFGEGDEPSTSDPGNSFLCNINTVLDVQNFLFSPHTMNGNVDVIDMDILGAKGSGSLVDLSTLLAKMFQYQCQLSKLYTCELDDYPIGDALFLSQQFCTILSDYRHMASTTGSSSDLHIPTILLILSCYMTLTQIYSFILRYLYDHLSQLQVRHSAHEPILLPHLMPTDMHAYQGLRLSDLRSTCVCTEWDLVTRAKKAISLLAGSLRRAEGAIGLPPDVRVMNIPCVESFREGSSSATVVESERTLLFEDGGIIEMGNGRFYKTLRDKARQLRVEMKELDEMLNRLLTTW